MALNNTNKRLVVALNFILVLGFFFFGVYKQEKIKRNGDRIILQLAPVDPRSLLQGDYMILRFELTDNLYRLDIEDEYKDGGYAIINKTKEGFYALEKVSHEWQEGSIEFTGNLKGNYSIGADSYFFQEGTGDIYSRARYAQLYLYGKGKVRVEALLDRNMKVIEGENK